METAFLWAWVILTVGALGLLVVSLIQEHYLDLESRRRDSEFAKTYKKIKSQRKLK